MSKDTSEKDNDKQDDDKQFDGRGPALAIRITSPDHNNNPALTAGAIAIQGYLSGPAGSVRLEAWIILNNGGKLTLPAMVIATSAGTEVNWTVTFPNVPSSSIPYPNNPHAAYVRLTVPSTTTSGNLATDHILINVS